MNEKMKKLSDICKMIFGYGIMIVLFAGGLAFLGYLVALFVGGETAAAICSFIYKQYFPIVIYVSTGLILFGLLTMYMAGEKALTSSKKKSTKEEGER